MEKKQQFRSIRSFIGANFYKDLGFSENILSSQLSYFKIEDNVGFYLQKANVKDWIDPTMLFLEVENIVVYLEGFHA